MLRTLMYIVQINFNYSMHSIRPLQSEMSSLDWLTTKTHCYN